MNDDLLLQTPQASQRRVTLVHQYPYGIMLFARQRQDMALLTHLLFESANFVGHLFGHIMVMIDMHHHQPCQMVYPFKVKVLLASQSLHLIFAGVSGSNGRIPFTFNREE